MYKKTLKKNKNNEQIKKKTKGYNRHKLVKVTNKKNYNVKKLSSLRGGFSTKVLSLKKFMKGSEKAKKSAIAQFNNLTSKKLLGVTGTVFLAYFIVQSFGLALIPIVIGTIISLFGISKHKEAELIISLHIIKILENNFHNNCVDYIEEQEQIKKVQLPIILPLKIDKYSDIYKLITKNKEIENLEKTHSLLVEKTISKYYSEKIEDFIRSYSKEKHTLIVELEKKNEDEDENKH